MPHKKETIQRVVTLLEKDYPQNAFTYALDTKRLMGTRIVPDVQVFSPNSNAKPVCVVEIGYTRPEKLHHYKQSGIEDVRWYGRDDGVLYSYGDVQPITHTVKVKYDFKPQIKDIWRGVLLKGCFECIDAREGFYKMRKYLDSIPTRFGKLRHILGDDCFDSVGILDHRQMFDDWDVVEYLIGGTKGKGNPDNLDEPICTDVFCTLWTNGQNAFIHRYCDVCGAASIDDYDDCDVDGVWWEVEENFKTYDSFMYKFRKQITSPWATDAEAIRAQYEMPLEQLLIKFEKILTLDILNKTRTWGDLLPWNWSEAKRKAS